MYLVTVRIDAPAPAAPAQCQALRQALGAIAGPAAGLEFAYAQPAAAGMELVLFIVAGALPAAEADAHRWVSEALASAGATAAWRIGFCGVDLFVPEAEARIRGGW